MTRSNIRNIAIVVLFISAVSISLLTPIRDNDFFWHLATGKWIAEHGELPTADPFAYTTPTMNGEVIRGRLILSMYWLAELLQYGVFFIAGFYGIIALRVIIVLLTMLAMALHMRKRGLEPMVVLFLCLPVCYVLFSAVGDRPNQMTFLFVAVFMFLLDALKRGEKKGYWLPVLVVVWANMHSGFILGAVAIIITTVSELLKKIYQPHYSVSRKFLTVMLLTVGAGFLNPNGYDIIYSILYESSAYYNASVAEARSPWSYILLGQYLYLWMLGVPLFFSAWYFLSALFERSSGLKDSALAIFDELLLIVFLVTISFTAIRYIPVFVIVAVPVMSPLFAGKFQSVVRRSSSWLFPELAAGTLFCWWIYMAFPGTAINFQPVDPMFPDDAVQFIKENNLKGRFYNYYDWGGYLIWQFYPEQFVFIDGRGINPDIFHVADTIINDQNSSYAGKSFYNASLDAYLVRHLIIPAIRMRGDIIYLLKSLEMDQQWRLIFVGRNSLVYTRDPTARDYPKTLGYVLAVSNALDAVKENLTNPLPYLAYAKANSYMGRSKVAVEGLEEALRYQSSLRGGSVERVLKLLKEGREIPVDFR